MYSLSTDVIYVICTHLSMRDIDRLGWACRQLYQQTRHNTYMWQERYAAKYSAVPLNPLLYWRIYHTLEYKGTNITDLDVIAYGLDKYLTRYTYDNKALDMVCLRRLYRYANCNPVVFAYVVRQDITDNNYDEVQLSTYVHQARQPHVVPTPGLLPYVKLDRKQCIMADMVEKIEFLQDGEADMILLSDAVQLYSRFGLGWPTDYIYAMFHDSLRILALLEKPVFDTEYDVVSYMKLLIKDNPTYHYPARLLQSFASCLTPNGCNIALLQYACDDNHVSAFVLGLAPYIRDHIKMETMFKLCTLTDAMLQRLLPEQNRLWAELDAVSTTLPVDIRDYVYYIQYCNMSEFYERFTWKTINANHMGGKFSIQRDGHEVLFTVHTSMIKLVVTAMPMTIVYKKTESILPVEVDIFLLRGRTAIMCHDTATAIKVMSWPGAIPDGALVLQGT